MRIALDGTDKKTAGIIRAKAMEAMDDPHGECPLLVGDECLLYSFRPVICRTHGFPVLVETEEGKKIDCCPLNFTDGKIPGPDHCLDLERLNATLVAVNRLFVTTVFEEGALPDRIQLADALLLELDNG
jgi:Fe-S-cluster containining protein